MIHSDPSRLPEDRMGHEFISRWLQVGDRLFIGTDGVTIFACKLDPASFSDKEIDIVSDEILSDVDDTYLDERIKAVPKVPQKKTTTSSEFVRSREIVEKAKRRSKYICDYPKCGWKGFIKQKGGQFIEVHHIIPLSEKGTDTMNNVAALCPECHRKQHYSENKINLRSKLIVEIKRKY